ncbi:MAG: methyltransferase domain-containing protein [Bacteroidetes bacterium]|nr:methyltransferase domain-containing protein [Bacteroidota bacterium]
MIEKEAWGVDYERYALGKLLKRFVKQYNIKKVLEIPAAGVKAMPSIYSLALGEAGCEVTLVNADEKSKRIWLSLGFNVHFVDVGDITQTNFKNGEFDFVWNFAIFPELDNKIELLEEMKRVSKKYVGVFAVNGYNVGAYVHRFLHKIKKIPWTHGDKKLLYYQNLKSLFLKSGLRISKIGAVDTPPWPDSIGFRDLRLHRMNIDFSKINWESNTIDYMGGKKYPFWIKLVYGFEKIPMFFFIKLLYSHIYFVLGEKVT